MIPLDIAQAMGGRKQFRVVGTFNGVAMKTSTFPYEGEGLWLGVHKATREKAGVALGEDVELEIIKSAPPVVTEPIESPVFEIIKRQVELREPHAVVVPYLIPGFTDAKYFTRMGARWYGFSPVKIEKESGIKFADMFHGHDERVPIAGLHWGTEVLDAVVREFSGASS